MKVNALAARKPKDAITDQFAKERSYDKNIRENRRQMDRNKPRSRSEILEVEEWIEQEDVAARSLLISQLAKE